MVSALHSGLGSLGSSPSWDHCAVFLDKTLHPHSAQISGVRYHSKGV